MISDTENIHLFEKLDLLYSVLIAGKNDYTSIPTGNPDIDLLMDGNETCWIAPNPVPIFQKKQIILSDFSVTFNIDITRLFDLSRYLIKEGFEVFAAIDNEKSSVSLEPITLDIIGDTESFTESLKQIKPIHPQNLELEIGKSHDIKIITINETVQFCYQLGLSNYNELNLTSFIQLPQSDLIERLSYIDKGDFLEIDISEETLKPQNLANLLLMLEKIKKIRITADFQSVPSFNDPVFKKIKKIAPLDLMCSSKIATYIFQNILKACHEDLEELMIITSDVANYFSAECTQNLTFPSLKKLTLSLDALSLNKEDIEALIKKAPQLKALELDSFEKITPVYFNELSELEELRLRASVEDKELIVFLKKLTKLKVLEISSNSLQSSAFIQYLPKELETLILHSGKISNEYFSLLPQQCPHLKKIDFRNLIFEGTIVLPDSLEDLTPPSDISEEKLSNILDTCPKLKKIDLRFTRKLTLKFLQHPKAIQLEEVRILLPTHQKNSSKIVNLSTKDILDIQKGKPLEKFLQPSIEKNQTKPGSYNLSLDKDTMGPSAPLKATQVFHFKKDKTPIIDYYRVDSFNNVSIKNGTFTPESYQFSEEDLENVFCYPLKRSKEESLQDAYKKQHDSNSPDIYFGQMTLPQGLNNWYKLTGLSTQDKFLDFEGYSDTEFEVKRNKIDHFFYVRPKTALTKKTIFTWVIQGNQKFFAPVPIDINIELLRQTDINKDGQVTFHPDLSDKISQLNASEKVSILYMFFNSFRPGKLDIAPDADDIKTMKAMLQQKKGICRHRTMLAKSFITALRFSPFEVVVNGNPIHTYLCYNNEIVNLGGGVTEIELTRLPKLPNLTIIRTNAATQKSVDAPLSPDNPYQTWKFHESSAGSPEEYSEEILVHAENLPKGKHNTLTLLQPRQIEGLHAAMLKQTMNKKRNFFYVNNLDSLKEKTFSYQPEKNESFKVDSELAQFIKHAKNGDVLMINWSNYQMKHVGRNALLDSQQRKFGDIAIPEGVLMVNVLDADLYGNMREDFYSRIPYISNYPKSLSEQSLPYQQIEKTLRPSEKNVTKSEADEYIDCEFYDEQWKKIMLGYFIPSAGNYVFQEGEFIKALRAKRKNIILRNAPWHLPEFRIFITELLEKGKVFLEGNAETIELPKEVSIRRDDTPYPLDMSAHSILPFTAESVSDNPYILNNETFQSFLFPYQCNDSGLTLSTGILKKHAKKTCIILITESLTEPMWAQLLAHAVENSVKIQLIVSPMVKIPPAMIKSAQSSGKADIGSNNAITSPQVHPRVILTDDVDSTAEVWQESIQNKNAIVIPIHESTTYEDLVERYFIKDKTKGLFDRSDSVLTLALKDKNKKPILLKGTPSLALTKKLESLFLPKPYIMINNERIDVTVPVTLMTESIPAIPFLKPTTQTAPSAWLLLQKKYPQNDNIIKKLKSLCLEFYAESQEPPFHYVQLKNMLVSHLKNPHSNPLKPFIRLKANYESSLKSHAENAWDNQKNQKIKSEETDVVNKRINKLEQILSISHYAFIAGLSGVGKSSFIQKELKKRYGNRIKIIEGLNNIDQWLESGKNSSLDKCVLFIDEANLYAPGTFDRLEGFFSEPRKILLAGRWQHVPENCELIFAGNFGNFAGRQKHPFFEKHGHVTIFKPLPGDFLENTVMMPLIKKLFPATNLKDQKNLCHRLLDVYNDINQLSSDKILLTARNLEMMILRYHYFLKEALLNNETAEAIAIYDELSCALPKNIRNTWVLEQNQLSDNNNNNDRPNPKKIKKALKKNVTFKDDVFMMTHSRQNPIRHLIEVFSIRETKISNPDIDSAGVSGVLMEAKPGVGKSIMSARFLKWIGFEKGNSNDELNLNSSSQKRYYHIEPTSIIEMETLLTKAFHEGAIVVIDEANTLPIEYCLNALLSGRDLTGKPAMKKGFLVISTQNSLRLALSDAVRNRLANLDLNDYTKEELVEILEEIAKKTDNHVSREYLSTQVHSFFTAQKYADYHKLHPEPTVRDLFNGPTPKK